MTLWLNNFIGIHVNNKRVRRVMKKAGLQAEIRKKKKFKVMSGNIHSYENILNREFRSDRPNQKLVTDITYIRTKKGNIFLSMIKDLFDNSIPVSYTHLDVYKRQVFISPCSGKGTRNTHIPSSEGITNFSRSLLLSEADSKLPITTFL